MKISLKNISFKNISLKNINLKNMNRRNIYIGAVALIAIIIAIVSIVKVMSKQDRGGFKLTCGDITLFDVEENILQSYAVSKDEVYTISVEDTLTAKHEYDIRLFGAECEIVTKDADKISIQAKEEGYVNFAVIIEYKGNVEGYAADREALDFFCSEYALQMEKELSVYILGDITYDEGGVLSIEKRVNLISKTNRLSVPRLEIVTEDEGDLKVSFSGKASLLVEECVIDAPNLDISFEPLIGHMTDANYDFYIDARSFNSEKLENSSIKVTSQAEWELLYDEGVFPTLENITDICFDGDFTIYPTAETEAYILDKAYNVEFKGAITFDGATLCFSSKEEGVITIDETKNEYGTYTALDFDVAGMDIVWRGSELLTYTYMNEMMNVKSFNSQATDTTLGGYGSEKLLSLETDGGEIRWTLTGNICKASVGYLVSRDILKSATMSATVSGGIVIFTENPEEVTGIKIDEAEIGMKRYETEDGEKTGVVCVMSDIDLTKEIYCVVIDEMGDTRSYRVQTELLTNDLPIISIDTKGDVEIVSKDEYIDAIFSLTMTDGTTLYNLESKSIQIRGRGSSTWKWEKKPYKIKFDNKTSIFGLEAAKDWVLLAGYSDKTFLRNTLAFDLGAKLDNLAWVPTTTPVDVFINGEYMGIYSIGEQIEAKAGRIEMAESSSEADADFLLEIGKGKSDGYDLGIDLFHTTTVKFWAIKNPDKEAITSEQFDFISDYVSKADAAVVALSGYEEYIDIESLIDWFILSEFSNNLDASFRRSTYAVKRAGEKLTFGPPWDFDLAFGNFSRDNKTYDTWCSLGEEDGYVKVNWMNYLITDENFTSKLKARWNEVKNTLYNTALTTIDEKQKSILKSQKDNFAIWDIMGKRVGFESPQTGALKTYEEQIEYLRNFIINRWKWMDEEINKF